MVQKIRENISSQWQNKTKETPPFICINLGILCNPMVQIALGIFFNSFYIKCSFECDVWLAILVPLNAATWLHRWPHYTDDHRLSNDNWIYGDSHYKFPIVFCSHLNTR